MVEDQWESGNGTEDQSGGRRRTSLEDMLVQQPEPAADLGCAMSKPRNLYPDTTLYVTVLERRTSLLERRTSLEDM